MMIHKGLLTHDGVVGSTTGKAIDLGFNGDFDVKNRAWNMVFVSVGAYSSQSGNVTATIKTVAVDDYKPGIALTSGKLYAYDGKIYACGTSKTATQNTGWAAVASVMTEQTEDALASKVASGTTIGTMTITEAAVKKGGVFGVPMPVGLKRLFGIALSGASGVVVTAGITDQVDTDCVPGADFTFLRAETKGVGQPGLPEKEAAVVNAGPADTVAAAQIATHAALTTGVHGLT